MTVLLMVYLSLLSEMSIGRVSHFIQDVPFLSTVVVHKCDLSLLVGDKFFSQMIVKPSIGYWA